MRLDCSALLWRDASNTDRLIIEQPELLLPRTLGVSRAGFQLKTTLYNLSMFAALRFAR